MLQVLQHNELDKKKWDACIASSTNGLIYSNSFYLDAISPGWMGIVQNDYSAVMPLTQKRKWGISYLAQPPFFQQGGITGENTNNEEVVNAFLEKAKEHFRYGEITLNYFNVTTHTKSLRKNYIISLQDPVELDKKFIEKYKKAKRSNVHYGKEDDVNMAVHLYKSLYQKHLPHFPSKAYNQFILICNHLQQTTDVLIRSVRFEGKVVALVLLLKFKKRWYNLMSCLTTVGRPLQANYYLYKHLLDELSGADMILDLEGSDMPGIEHFYKKMATKNEPYPFVHFNNLPFLIKLIKQ
ncbi:MAG: hypothetical protein KF829_08820 [Ferruginibacter sp.]|nr:hypothetical protein [Ferruginibacter sp.]